MKYMIGHGREYNGLYIWRSTSLTKIYQAIQTTWIYIYPIINAIWCDLTFHLKAPFSLSELLSITFS